MKNAVFQNLSQQAIAYVCTSADDLRSSVLHTSNVGDLRQAANYCESNEKKTHLKILESRIRRLCGKDMVNITIRFVVDGQDFSEWDINAEGFIIDSRPFQAMTWVGCKVLNLATLKIGDCARIQTWFEGEGKEVEIRYPVAAIKRLVTK